MFQLYPKDKTFYPSLDVNVFGNCWVELLQYNF